MLNNGGKLAGPLNLRSRSVEENRLLLLVGRNLKKSFLFASSAGCVFANGTVQKLGEPPRSKWRAAFTCIEPYDSLSIRLL